MSADDPLIGVHNGTFHSDETLAVYLLRQLPEYAHSRVIRTRDPAELAKCHIVCDVGEVYDHSIRRYDHHQLNYNGKFPGSDIPCCAVGLVWVHYGQQISELMLRKKFPEVPQFDIEKVWRLQYEAFIKEIDATDNGVSQHKDGSAYSIHSTISDRIMAMNPDWRAVNPDIDAIFEQAVEVIGREFEFFLEYTYRTMENDSAGTE
jgi:uncharacterized UPF0160 family protein